MDRAFYQNFFSRYNNLVILSIVSLLLALVYGYSQFYFTHSSLIVIKASSILLLALLVRSYNLNDKIINKLLITALLFHAMGDIVIELAPSFIYSIPFFAVGHIIYCGVIVKMVIANFKPTWLRAALLAGIFCLAAYLLTLVSTWVSGLLFVNVIVYAAILTVLTVVTALHPACFKFLIFGVIAYVISDFILAYHYLVQNLHLKVYLSWPFYYMAQFTIIASLLNHCQSISKL